MNRQFQMALARAYIDSDARLELYRGETAGFASLGLNPTELTSLAEFAQQNRDRLELYASILVKKKGTPLQKRLPVMYEVLRSVESEGWNRMWAEFYAATPPSEGDAPQEQTAAFASHVASRAVSFGAQADLVAEVARYELAKLSLTDTATAARPNATEARAQCPFVPGPVVVENFLYDFSWVKSRFALEDVRPQLSQTPILFCRHAETGVPVVARITNALARIIARCDGRTTLEEIARLTRENEELPVAAVANAVSVLMARGVVEKTREGLHEHV